jgi:mannan endo-1,4-beta-mannosidase
MTYVRPSFVAALVVALLLFCWVPRTYAQRPASVPAGSMYVVGPQLFDASGKVKHLAGVNKAHWDQRLSIEGIPLSGANAVRVSVAFSQSQATNWNVVDPILAAGLTPIVGSWATTCNVDPAKLVSTIDTWVAQVSTWTKYNQTGIINPGNEWGPAGLTKTVPNYTWRDAYVTGIPRMRLAGYNGLIMVDAPGCGQDWATVVRDGAAVLAADPQHNIVFDVHLYGAGGWKDLDAAFGSLKSSGLAIVVGEFGPGLHVGPSPTVATPEDVVARTAAAGLVGWLAWAWDDNNMTGCKTSDTGWFGMTNYCGRYRGMDTDLTAFGRAMIPLLKGAPK